MLQKTSILFLYSSQDYGGLVTNVAKIINCLNRDLFEVFLVSLESNNPCANLLNHEVKTTILELNCVGRFDLNALNRLIVLIKSEKIKILNADGYKADFYCCLARLFCKFTSITILHGWVSQTRKLKFYQALDKLLYYFFDRIILLSPAQLVRHPFLKRLKHKITIIPNGIEVNTSTPAINDTSISQNKIFTIGTCSRLVREKRVDILVEACSKLNLNTWKLIIIGSGPELEKLKTQCAKLGITTQVEFMGYQKNVLNLIGNFDVFVSCSMFEGFPNSILEAGSLAVPLVVSRIPEHSYIINDNVNGVLFELNNATELAIKLEQLQNNPQFTQNMGKNIQITIKDKFSMAIRKELLEKTYLQMSC